MRRFFCEVLVGACLCLAVNSASADVSGTGSGFTIPDNSPNGAISYIGISAPIDEIIQNVSVTLTGISHTFVGDLNATLSGPAGDVDLFFRTGRPGTGIGSQSDLNGNYTFADGGADWWAAAAGTGVIPSGTYAPTTMLGTVTSLADTYADFLANGTWMLNLSDNAPGDVGSLVSWNLDITSSVSYEFDTDAGVVSINGTPTNQVNGTTFSESVVNGMRQFRFDGDLKFTGEVIVTGVGSMPLSLLAGNDVIVEEGVTFDFDAIGQAGQLGGGNGGNQGNHVESSAGGGGFRGGPGFPVDGGAGGQAGSPGSPGVTEFAGVGGKGGDGRDGAPGGDGATGGLGGTGGGSAWGTIKIFGSVVDAGDATVDTSPGIAGGNGRYLQEPRSLILYVEGCHHVDGDSASLSEERP